MKNTIIMVERLFEEGGEGFTLRNTMKAPFLTGYKPELDVTDELGPELVSWYLQLIGIFRSALEIRRVDTFLEVSLLSQYQAGPRLGHLEVLFDVFVYLKNHKYMGNLHAHLCG